MGSVGMEKEISEKRADFLAKDYSRGFIKYCRFEADDVRRGYFQSRVKIEDQHRQQDGFIHAGVMATMADHTAGYAGFTTVGEEIQILTVEFKVNFLKPAHGEALVCRSKVIRGGNTIIISESEVLISEMERRPWRPKPWLRLWRCTWISSP